MRLRKKRKHGKTEVEDVDITSLLDILVILLVFLLKSFNDSDLTVDLVNELALPYSVMRGNAADGVTLQVNKRKNIFLNAKPIGNLENASSLNILSKKLYKQSEILKNKKKKTPHLINLIFDKGLKYSSINTVLDVSAKSGFGKYKLIIQGDE
jgi:biopolymer transport protein ExbD